MKTAAQNRRPQALRLTRAVKSERATGRMINWKVVGYPEWTLNVGHRCYSGHIWVIRHSRVGLVSPAQGRKMALDIVQDHLDREEWLRASLESQG